MRHCGQKFFLISSAPHSNTRLSVSRYTTGRPSELSLPFNETGRMTLCANVTFEMRNFSRVIALVNFFLSRTFRPSLNRALCRTAVVVASGRGQLRAETTSHTPGARRARQLNENEVEQSSTSPRVLYFVPDKSFDGKSCTDGSAPRKRASRRETRKAALRFRSLTETRSFFARC